MMYKILFSVCIAACALASALHAAEGKRVNLKNLEAKISDLQRLAAQATSQTKAAFLQEVLTHAQHVVDNADYLTVDEVQMAADGVKKAEAALAHHSHWSSSSSSDCDACSELSELDSEFQDCCNNVLELLFELRELLAIEFPCDPPIPISAVPFVITESGKYCVTQNLVYNGPDAAITVAANNVTINFHNNSLTINDPDADGITAEDVTEFTLLNDIIQGPGSSDPANGVAIRLERVSKAHIDNVYTYNTVRGIYLVDCVDVLVENSLLRSHRGTMEGNFGAGIEINGSVGVTMDNLVFEGSDVAPFDDEFTVGLLVYGDAANIALRNSVLTNWFEAVDILQVTGFIMDHCMAIAPPFTDFCLLQLGGYYPELVANDVIIRNSTFEQHTLVTGFDGLLLVQGSGAIFENVVVDVATTGEEEGYSPGAIHIGCGSASGCVDPTLAYTNLYARDCIVRGENQFGLYIEAAEDVTFSHSQFTDATINVLFYDDALHCQVLDSLISNAGGFGALFNSDATENAIVNCQVSDSDNGIFVSNTALRNQVKGNRVFGNSNSGIENLDPSTDIYFNTSCNNGVTNCSGVFVTRNPGDIPLQAGSNICCSNPD